MLIQFSVWRVRAGSVNLAPYGVHQLYHSGFGAVVNVERTELSDDPDTATAQTIALMGRFAREDAASDVIRAQAARLRGSSQAESVRNVWNWIRARVRFVSDRALSSPLPDAAAISEVLVRPVDIVRMVQPSGDCDDFSMLGASLFLALGIPVAFVTVAADQSYPDQYSHVYLEVAGVPVDCSHGPYIGWETANRFGKRRVWPLDGGLGVIQSVPHSVTGAPGMGGLGVTETTPWWQRVIEDASGVLQDVFKSRYGVPPEGTLIQTPEGMISRVGYPSGFGLQLNTPGTVASSIPTWAWVVGGAALVVFLTRGKK